MRASRLITAVPLAVTCLGLPSTPLSGQAPTQRNRDEGTLVTVDDVMVTGDGQCLVELAAHRFRAEGSLVFREEGVQLCVGEGTRLFGGRARGSSPMEVSDIEPGMVIRFWRHEITRPTRPAWVRVVALEVLFPPSREFILRGPTFTPFSVAPTVLNRDEVLAAVQSEYPAHLREAGVGGTVRIFFLLDHEGQVLRRVIDESSGNEELDAAALRVARIYRFSEARRRDRPVFAWVSMPITFGPE